MVKLKLALAFALLAAAPALGGVDVLVGRYDLRGSGANLRENVLNTANVNPARFGKLFSYEIEGAIYAQPLVVSGLLARGRLRNVLYVATTNNLVYALDADDPGPDGGLLWQVRLTHQGGLPAPSVKTEKTVQGNIGILSTPFIDRARGVIYVVARSLGPGGFRQRLHALDIVTGSDRPRSPVDIAPAALIRDGITFNFDPAVPSNRAGLTMSGASLVVAWAGLDADHGWVMSFDADTLQRTGIFCTTCARSVPTTRPLDCAEPQKPWLIGGGIWQSGRPPVVDAQGHVYAFAGNGLDPRLQRQDGLVRQRLRSGQPKPSWYYGEASSAAGPAKWPGLGRILDARRLVQIELRDLDLGGSGPALIDFRLAGGGLGLLRSEAGKKGALCD